jgi:hypothetical protein
MESRSRGAPRTKLSLLFRMIKRGVSLTEALRVMRLKQVVQMP